MTSSPALTELPDEALHGEVKRLAGRANTLLAELLAHLAEVEARGIHRERACAFRFNDIEPQPPNPPRRRGAATYRPTFVEPSGNATRRAAPTRM